MDLGEVKRVLLGDLNAKIGKVMIEGVTGKYGVSNENENGDMLLDLCAEKGLGIGNTLIMRIYTSTRGWETEKEVVEDMLDYIIVDERLRKRLEDVRVRREVGAGMSDHMMVEGKIKLGSERRVKDCRRVKGKPVKV